MDAVGLFKRPCEFMAGAATIESLPDVTHPEICFIGRSNVGKSSLVNALIGQKALARTSQNPGATQQLNFFLLGEILMLVDMPGYGFARVSKAQKGQWDMLIRSYLSGRPSLRRVCLLIDARRGVMPVDDEFMKVLNECAIIYYVVLTKLDSVKQSDRAKLFQDIETKIKSNVGAHPVFFATSAETGEGLDALKEELAPFAVPL